VALALVVSAYMARTMAILRRRQVSDAASNNTDQFV
jgi:hypothetical protein